MSDEKNIAADVQSARGFVRNVAANWAGEFVTIASGFILPRLIDRHMSRDELGIWDYGWSIRAYVGLAITNLGSATGYYVARYRASGKWDTLERTLGGIAGLILYGALGAGLLIVLLARWAAVMINTDAPHLIDAARFLIVVMGLSACVATAALLHGGMIVGFRRFDQLNIIEGGCDVLMVAGLLASLLMGGGLYAMGACVLGRDLLSWFAKYRFARRLVPQVRIRLRASDLQIFREILGFSAKTLTDSVAKVLQNQAPVSVIAFYLNPAAVALYSRSRALIIISTRFVMGFTRVLVPHASALGERQDRKELARLLVQATRGAMFLALVPGLILLLFGNQVVQVWMGPAYVQTAVLAILVIGFLPLFAQQATFHVLLGVASHGLPSAASLVGAVIGAVLAILFVGVAGWGIVGAAAATAIPVFIVNAFFYPYAGCRAVGVPARQYAYDGILRPVASMLPFAAVLVGVRLLGPTHAGWQLALALAAGLPVLALIFWRDFLPPRLRQAVLDRMLPKASVPMARSVHGPMGGQCKPSICFVSPNAYPVLANRSDLAHVGGAEIQQTFIARELVRRGYTVSFITVACGQPDGVEYDGIRVYAMYRPDAGWPVVRFFHPRWSGLWRAMRRADADVYYQRGAGAETGQVALWCWLYRRPFVFAVAHEADCTRASRYLRTTRERMLHRHGLRSATRVIAQTKTQAGALRDNFGIESTVIRSCSRDPVPVGAEKEESANRATILWVGRLTAQKRPEVLLDLAESAPELEFEVVGGANTPNGEPDGITQRAARLPNVKFRGRVPYSEMDQYYRRAAVLLCTSEWEGFPNTFMEAWARGIPTVSTVDPDDVITTNGLGGVARGVADLKLLITDLLRSPERWNDRARRARGFFLEHHSIATAADAYETVISQVCPGRAGEASSSN